MSGNYFLYINSLYLCCFWMKRSSGPYCMAPNWNSNYLNQLTSKYEEKSKRIIKK